MSFTMRVLYSVGVVATVFLALPRWVRAAETWDGTIVQYGKMHEAIGKQQHQGRVLLDQLVARPHFFGVAALKELQGEVTIRDGQVTITSVDTSGHLKVNEEAADKAQATMLVGAYVPSWKPQQVTESVDSDQFDQFIADAAAKTGIDVSKPFIFTIEGEFTQVRLHVLNGACPLHARLKKIDLAQNEQPFDADFENVEGTLVGVFAKNAVGDLTHPGTSVHAHLVYQDADSGKTVTGHVEQVGLIKGAVLQLPKTR